MSGRFKAACGSVSSMPHPQRSLDDRHTAEGYVAHLENLQGATCKAK